MNSFFFDLSADPIEPCVQRARGRVLLRSHSLEIVVGNCEYIKRHFPGTTSVIGKADGGLEWRPSIPEALVESQPELVHLIEDCVLDDFTTRPAFFDITARLAACKATSQALREVDLVELLSTGPA